VFAGESATGPLLPEAARDTRRCHKMAVATIDSQPAPVNPLSPASDAERY
jgi:hypothetical protein